MEHWILIVVRPYIIHCSKLLESVQTTSFQGFELQNILNREEGGRSTVDAQYEAVSVFVLAILRK